MGCFNKIGFSSHLPITCGDDIVLFICISTKNLPYDTSPIAPFELLKPICLPILGKYDEYGSIDDIVHDNHVNFIEKCFDVKIEDIINAIQECSCKTINDLITNKSIDKRCVKIYTSILSKIKNHSKHIYGDNFDNVFSLTFTMERLDVYALCGSEYEYQKSHELLQKIIETNEKHNFENVNIFDKYATVDLNLNSLSDYKDKDEKFLSKVRETYKFEKLIEQYSNVNYFSHCSLPTFYFFDLGTFDIKENVKLINDFSDFCNFLSANCINFSLSSYGNQCICKETSKMIKIHEEYIKILKNKTE